MKVVHFLEGRPKPESANGVVKAVYYLTKYEQKFHDVEVWCTSSKIKDYNEMQLDTGILCKIFPSDYVKFSYYLHKQLVKIDVKRTVFHLHGVFNKHNYIVAVFLLQRKIPYIISPHGAIVRYAIVEKSLKKYSILPLNVFYLCYSRRIRLISSSEFGNLFVLFKKLCKKKIIIVPNGVEVSNKNDFSCERSVYNRKYFKFIGRLTTYTKGLDFIVEVAKRFENIKFYISGPDEDFLERYKELPGNIVVNKEIFGEEKKKFLSNAYFFIHPSRHEVGFPLSILEALSLGIPVITTERVDSDFILEKHGAGFVTKVETDALAKKISLALHLSYKGWCRMKRNTKTFVMNNFNWQKIAESIHIQYEGVLFGA